METDEMELDTIGDRKTALFVIISDTDDTFNFVVSILYTQLFNLLCDKADDVYGGRLPVHVRCLLDEFANIGQIPKFEKLIATIRSREISASIILQSQSQLEIYLYCSVSPIPFATMTNREWGQIGNNYLKSLFAIGFQGFLIMICVGIYAVLVNNMIIADNLHSAIFSLAAYTVILCFSLFKSGALAKSIFSAH